MAGEVIVRVLGSVGVVGRDGQFITGPAKQSCVLAALALHPGQPVTLGALISMVWNQDPPVSALNVVYGHINRLRRQLNGRAAIRHSRDEGYTLDIEPQQIDLHAARALASDANEVAETGDLSRAVALWREASQWWAEPALFGIDSVWARRVRESLGREQVAVYSGWLAIELTLGRHAAVVHPLRQLRSGQRTVTAAFDISFRELDDETERAFCLLGMAPGPDFEIHAAAALLDRDIYSTEDLLECLVDNNLLRSHPDGRFAFHDLMGQYAQRAAQTGHSEPELFAARRRIIDMYCAAAAEASRRGDTMTFQSPTATSHDAPTFPRIPDATAAFSWWYREWRNVVEALVLAVEQNLESQAFLGVTTLWSYLNLVENVDHMTVVSRRALEAARPHTGSALESWMLTFHALALFRLGDLPEALRHLESSLEIRRAHGDVAGQAKLRHNIGLVLTAMGRFEPARGAFSQACADFEAASDNLSMMCSKFERALVHARLGLADEAWHDMKTAEGWLADNGTAAQFA